MSVATIRDVARRADVSIASVSRALNSPATVQEATRERVFAAVEALGYVPHAGARSLSTRLSNAIGVVLPDLHGEFFSELVRGMDREASALGYQLFLSTMHADASLGAQALRAMRGRVDGLIVMAPQLDAAALEALLPGVLPTVLINCAGDTGLAGLRIDNRHGVEVVIEHLVGRGRKRIVHIAGPMGNLDAIERAEAYCSVMAKVAPDSPVLVVEGDFSEEAGGVAVRKLAAEGVNYDALFAANDMMALGALMALREAGVDVPGSIALSGFDDVPLARYLGVTTVRVRMDELGAGAVARLVAQLRGEGRDDGIQLMQPLLVERETTR